MAVSVGDLVLCGLDLLRSPGLSGVPHTAIPLDHSRAIPIDMDTVTRKYEARRMVLEGNGIVIRRLSPVLDVRTKGPGPSPFDRHIVDHRVELRVDEVVLVFGKGDGATGAALLEGREDVRDVAAIATVGIDSALFALCAGLDIDCALLRCLNGR